VRAVRAEVVLVTREPKLKIFKFKSGSAQSQSFHSLYSHKGVDWNQLVLVVSHTHARTGEIWN
jgi:hypothetical protein